MPGLLQRSLGVLFYHRTNRSAQEVDRLKHLLAREIRATGLCACQLRDHSGKQVRRVAENDKGSA